MSSGSELSLVKRDRGVFLAALSFFFVSGACGLLYQIVWTRKLVLLFGTTSYAVSTVLSIFFLGLALGSMWGGRLADSNARPLRLYGYFEIIIGIWALMFILFVGAGESVVVSILKLVGPSYALGIGLRGLMAALFLLVPVTLMGATLPLVSRFVTANNPVQGLRIGALYSLNTFGAVAGCMLTGFVLLANLGYTRTTLVGAVLNVSVGLMALMLSKQRESDTAIIETEAESVPENSGLEVSPRMAMFVVGAFAISGFCSLALEVLWMRLLTILFLGTTYAFTTMLTSVLCGIALGSTVASLRIDKIQDRVSAYGFIQALTGASCLLTLMVFPHLPDMLRSAQEATGLDWSAMVFRKFMLSFAVLLVPTFLFGMSFPFAVRIIANSPLGLGKSIGRVYSANTFGGVIGSLVGGFIVIPTLGTQNGIVLLSLVLAASGFVLLAVNASARVRHRVVLGGVSAAGIAVGFLMMPSDVSLSMNRWFMPEEQQLVAYTEGVEGTVMVTGPAIGKEGSDRVLWINATQATASIEKGVKMNRFQGVLPLFFDRPMNEALFMCFGSGITAGTLAQSPFERIDTVEISKNVLEMAQHFKTDNFDVLNNERINVIVDDGRNFLLTTDNTYDLITFEPMPLALSGVSTFYTREYYELCLAHLNDEGLVSQWIPLHNGLHLDIVQSLVKTFTDVFPEVSVWFINADLFFIGSKTPQTVNYSALEKALDANGPLKNGLDEVYLRDVPELFASYFMNKAEAESFAGDAKVMRDDLPWAEFLAPKMIYSGNVREILEALQPYRRSPLELLAVETSDAWPTIQKRIERRHLAHVQDLVGLQAYYGGFILAEPEVHFRKSLEIDPDDCNAQYYISEILVGRGGLFLRWGDKMDETFELLLEARKHAPYRTDVHKLLGDAYLEIGDSDAALESYREHVRLGGTDSDAQSFVKAAK
ncbi:MAG: fused MFS/spermidine synthase [Candidatus Hydrogenedentota bacterium]